ncbi:MAG TPA: insulinase family protein [Patescibacteria group bacterium]|nr:insulinase family protein [Patescibacteria group bacterium]
MASERKKRCWGSWLAIVMVWLCWPGTALAEEAYSGYTLLEERPVDEIRAQARWFRHDKSGAQLVAVQNDDDNKFFSITFRTPPADSSGVAHILEHSVLCGSRKYPVKAPFATMNKSSLYTFLNAFTSPDKTTYPVSSRNDKDFRQLMDVYMDAVFHPRLEQQPEIFSQEGWHYELENEQQPLTYKGVVYNEMKGAYSSPEGLLARSIPASLLPDTVYRHVAGGDPDRIPELSREAFLAFYHRYYHPSNSYIFLYGKLDLADTLRFLDKEYLNEYDQRTVDSAIRLQAPLATKQDLRLEYPVGAADSTENRTYLSMNFVIGQAEDLALMSDFSRLENLLLGSPAAPLKKAILDAGIGKEVYGSFSSGRRQPIFSIIVTNAEEDQKEALEAVVRSTLVKLAAGIDRESIRTAFDAAEFRRRETLVAATNKGMVYSQVSLSSWLYGGDPLTPLGYRSRGKDKALAGGYFEELIRKYLLNSQYMSTVMAVPRPGLESERTLALQKRLNGYRDSLSAAEAGLLMEQTRKLKEWQQTPDSPENIGRMPVLERRDLNPRAEKLAVEEYRQDDVRILLHPQPTQHITYLDLYFDSSTVSREQLPYLHLLAQLLGRVSTGQHSYLQLDQAVKANTGGISWEVDAFSDRDNDETFQPQFILHFQVLNEKLPVAVALLDEIITDSRFDDLERLRELIGKSKARWQSWLLNDGATVAVSRALSYGSPVGAYREAGDLTFYRFLEELEQQFGERGPEVSRQLQNVRDAVFRRAGLVASITTERQDYPAVLKKLSPVWRNRNTEPAVAADYAVALVPGNEGLVTAGKVQYVARIYNFRRLGYEYSGKMRVLQTILSTDYLWNRVRVGGGAYGAAARLDRTGTVLLWSWRDPNLAETLAAYDDVAEYLRSFDADEREMNNYIIATIGRLDAPLSPHRRGEMAAAASIRRITDADLQKERDEILSTTAVDIRQYAALFDDLRQQDHFCVLGSETALTNNRTRFHSLLRVVR